MAGLDRVIDTLPVMKVGIFPLPQVILVAIIVGLFIDHETATLDLDGVAVFQEAHQFRTVIAALIMAPREVLALIEDDLQNKICISCHHIPRIIITDSLSPCPVCAACVCLCVCEWVLRDEVFTLPMLASGQFACPLDRPA